MSRHRGSGTGSGSGGGAASSSGNACSGRVVTINLSDHPPNVPLGVLLAPACPTYTTTPEESTLTILAGWERLPESEGGGLGPIQRTGQVRLGDRLVRINNADVRARSFRQVMDMLKSMGARQYERRSRCHSKEEREKQNQQQEQFCQIDSEIAVAEL